MYFKIKLHSTIDLITNSSTEIFINSDASSNALDEMVDEFLKQLDSQLRCKDIFHMVVLSDSLEIYQEYLDRQDSDFLEKQNQQKPEDFDKFIDGVISGKNEKPTWFLEAEAKRENTGTTLYISPKKKKYTKLAGLIREFLYSTEAVDYYS
jgi:hypothetical protein